MRLHAWALTALLVTACADDDDEPAIDAQVNRIDGGSVDAGAPDAGPSDAAPPDAPGTDAAPSNNSTWEAADGLPESACTGWTLQDTAEPEVPVLADGALTLASSTDAEFMAYAQAGDQLIEVPNVVIEARMRLVSGASSVPYRAPAILVFRLGAALQKNLLGIEDGKIFLLTGENVRGAEVAVATTDAFHDYRIEVVMATGAITVFRDDVQVLTGQTYTEPQPVTTPAIVFGDGTNGAYGVSQWQRVSHNTHAANVCP